jgi:hypothetical protein
MRCVHNRMESLNDTRNTMETHRGLNMRNIKNIKMILSAAAVIAVTVAVNIIAVQGAASKKSTHEQKIERIMVDYVRAIQTAENAYDNKMAPLIKSTRTIRDRAITKAGQAVQMKLARAAKDSKRLGRPDEAKLAEEEIAELTKLTKTAQTTDPYKPEAEAVIEEPVVETGPLPSHVVLRGHSYIAFMGECRIFEATATCKRLGGRLVCIGSAEELLFLQKELPVGHTLWVGASDPRHKGEWRWSTGAAVHRSCWAPKQPVAHQKSSSDGTWSRTLAALRSDGMHVRSYKDKCRGFICEWSR